jgi:menaquinone-dependent protoporphyrinogen oxidase
MISVLIPYATHDGHTRRIADFVARVIRERGFEATAVDIKRSRLLPPDAYDAVIVGASIRMGKHDRYATAFVRRNRGALERVPSAFFSVSLAAHDDTESGRNEVRGYIERFVQRTGWRPKAIGVIAGALLYTQYDFLTRWMMKKIARDHRNPDLDTTRDYVYTDWGGVRRFVDDFLEQAFPESCAVIAERAALVAQKVPQADREARL